MWSDQLACAVALIKIFHNLIPSDWFCLSTVRLFVVCRCFIVYLKTLVSSILLSNKFISSNSACWSISVSFPIKISAHSFTKVGVLSDVASSTRWTIAGGFDSGLSASNYWKLSSSDLSSNTRSWLMDLFFPFHQSSTSLQAMTSSARTAKLNRVRWEYNKPVMYVRIKDRNGVYYCCSFFAIK